MSQVRMLTTQYIAHFHKVKTVKEIANDLDISYKYVVKVHKYFMATGCVIMPSKMNPGYNNIPSMGNRLVKTNRKRYDTPLTNP